MELAKKRGFEGINPRWFLEAAAKEGACCSVGDVISFFLNVINIYFDLGWINNE